ncbi:sulfate permease [Mollisia scopiformis]|uniref:Sulfate permease n=1 Tax=Mollisia scopiformis TaxID=149040 RepID=A0A194WZE8_MOLSC|nr:sulfate permease [Mollisia scopiformis]KUJ13325.1 sulfate permease [Mollisia scopiformis]
MTSIKIGHAFAKALGIKLNQGKELDNEIRQGHPVFSTRVADAYVEDELRSSQWVKETLPSTQDLVEYCRSLFPFLGWIGHYNLQWLVGDVVAGVTIGAVIVPQSMAYAVLADLPVQFGLYSSFIGALIYWLMGTSKDINIGPVGVASTVVGKMVATAAKTHPNVPGHVVASALAVVAGCIMTLIGLIRAGWLVNLIPLVSISAFMTGSAFSIATLQLGNLMGISGIEHDGATYHIFIEVMKGLSRIKLDAAIGFTALFLLYSIRWGCRHAAQRFPRQSKLLFFISTLRIVFVILLYTLVSWLVNKDHHKHPLFKIISAFPRGFQAAGVPWVDASMIKIFIGDLPATVIVLMLEHISIAKSFGRVNGYTINPSQEMVATGVTNIVGPFLGAYPVTGSFCRSAVNSKAGVRTPLGGIVTAMVVLLAIYALPAVFFFVPKAALSAVIIHAIMDLVTSPNTVYQFWKVSPLDVPIFFVGVFMSIFSSIENGIYSTICISLFLALFRIIKAKGRFLGKVIVHSVSGDSLLATELKPLTLPDSALSTTIRSGAAFDEHPSRSVFMPMDHADGTNPEIEVLSPYPGIVIYRFCEGFSYLNANSCLDQLTHHIFATTRRTNPNHYLRPGDRPWSDPGPLRGETNGNDCHSARPILKAIILDFSSVNNVDVTSIQQLIDVRNQLDQYASPLAIDWHFSSIHNKCTKRALVAAGFGYPTAIGDTAHQWQPIFSIAEVGGSESTIVLTESDRDEKVTVEQCEKSIGYVSQQSVDCPVTSMSTTKLGDVKTTSISRAVVVNGLNRPLFHIDLTSALQSAVTIARAREDFEARGGLGTGGEP